MKQRPGQGQGNSKRNSRSVSSMQLKLKIGEILYFTHYINTFKNGIVLISVVQKGRAALQRPAPFRR